VPVTPNGFKIVCNAFSIALVQAGVLVVVLLAVVPVLLVPVLLVPVDVLLLGTLVVLLLLGALVVVVPDVVPVLLVPVVELPVPEVVLLVLVAHPAYVADAPKSCRILETRPSMVEQELVLVPVVEVEPLVVELPEEPVLLHAV
jgi:hypothetical protein